jgi:hypothetical protein
MIKLIIEVMEFRRISFWGMTPMSLDPIKKLINGIKLKL